MENFVVNEFFDEKKTGLQKEFSCFSEVEDFMKYFNNGSYPTCYKNNPPPYPHVLVRIEILTEYGPINNKPYCYYAK